MIRAVAVLRPEPGNGETVKRLRAAGLTPVALPLFETRPRDWTPPDAGAHDALFITSANAIRHAGRGLGMLATLPVLAVGAATAQVAQTAGLVVAMTGHADAADLATRAAARGYRKALHLAGADHVEAGPPVSATAIVYASEAIAGVDPAPLAGTVALVHSARAGARLAELAGAERSDIAIAAISDKALAAAGPGWRATVVAREPNEAALIEAARALAD